MFYKKIWCKKLADKNINILLDGKNKKIFEQNIS